MTVCVCGVGVLVFEREQDQERKDGERGRRVVGVKGSVNGVKSIKCR